jgi:uncharacterized SAM-binding protein YcdF (DUF218 family)
VIEGKKQLSGKRKAVRRPIIRPIILVFFVVFGALFLVSAIASVQILLCYSGDDEIPENAVVIVLGCGLSPVDQTSPSVMLGGRLRTAEKYIAAHPDATVILSGGQGADERISEAEAMRRWFEAGGYDRARFVIEDKSDSTATNLQNSRLVCEEYAIAQDDVVVITDGFHQFRARYFAKQFGFTPYSVSSCAPTYLQVRFWFREIAAIVVQVWLGG